MSDFEAIMRAAKSQPQAGAAKEAPKPARKRRAAASVWDDLIPAKEETKRLNLDISESTDRALSARAKKLKITKSALVRLLIDSYLQNIE